MIRSSTIRVGFQVRLVFTISQHIRDKQLMTSLVQYLDCGNIYENRGSVDLVISKFNDLENIVLPLFGKYPILGVKFEDYLDFIKILEIMQNKAHITIEGIDKIRNIKAGMNKGRIFSLHYSVSMEDELLKKEALSIKQDARSDTCTAILAIEDTNLKMRTIGSPLPLIHQGDTGRGNPVNVYEKFDSDGFKLIGSFVSAKRAGKFLEISGNTIIKYMRSGVIFKERYKFSGVPRATPNNR